MIAVRDGAVGLSVIIPTHRRPGLLGEAIGSVLAQRSLPSEIVVVDDADDEDTKRLVARHAQDCPLPIRYVANGQGGVCRSRNLGARASRGAWLAFLDDDDVWADTYLRQARRRLHADPGDFLVAGLLRHEAGRPPARRVQAAGLRSDAILQHPASMTGSNLVIRRDALFRVGGFDPEMTVFNDWDLLVRLVDAGLRYTVAADAVAEWRDHAGPRIATPSLRRADGIARFLRRYRARLSPKLRRDLETTALGIRRSHAGSAAEWLLLTGRLAVAHGPGRSIRRLAARLGQGGPASWDGEARLAAGVGA